MQPPSPHTTPLPPHSQQMLVDTMLGSVPMLLDVVILAVFYYVLFGIIAINIFAGSFRYR